MKKKLLSLVMALAIGVTGSAGFTSVVSAANTMDTTFSFYNGNASGTTEWRNKNDYTTVYVYPKEGPDLYYTVYGREKSKGGNGTPRSNKVIVPRGVKGSIANVAKTNGDNEVRLSLERRAVAYLTTSGVWSPDSTRNYTIIY